jgi:hypothetical protein
MQPFLTFFLADLNDISYMIDLKKKYIIYDKLFLGIWITLAIYANDYLIFFKELCNIVIGKCQLWNYVKANIYIETTVQEGKETKAIQTP